MRQHVLPLMAVLVLASSTLQAETTFETTPKYQKGMVISSEIEVALAQTLQIAANNFETKNDSFITTEEVVREAEDGNFVIDGKIVSMQATLGLPGGNSVEFDTQSPDNENPGGPFGVIYDYVKLASDATWVTTVGSDGMIKRLEYPEELTSEVPSQFSSEFDGERTKQQANQRLARLPDDAVSKGDVWTRSEEVGLGSGQLFHVDREFTYQGEVEHDGRTLHQIDVVTKTVEYDAGDSLPGIECKSSDLKLEESDGTLYYDAATNMIVESTESMHVVGSLVLVANGQEVPAQLDLTMTNSLKQSVK